MDRGNLDNHRRILGICLILTNALSLLAALAVGGFFFIWGSMFPETTSAGDLALFWLIAAGISGCVLLMGLPGVLAGIGLLRRRKWARLLSLIVGAVGLANVPLGTIVGIYAIWFYAQPGSLEVLE
ncbi:hypothetical protein LZ198_21400 [Myxococcus sp. K15C18031901]|uniref:hypothetical protein n=1 Tax=Myxococcus dinghuensis TaxID=2906761 RepID=UPI0020A78FBC|nr:hypothetical protein [Myxococcus dinghuensis]MCP3101434.1 hypothetical protein [Myxococcus dinghuensis]